MFCEAFNARERKVLVQSLVRLSVNAFQGWREVLDLLNSAR
jgi:hypothetical protein